MDPTQRTWPSHPLSIYQLAMSTLARSGSVYITAKTRGYKKTKGDGLNGWFRLRGVYYLKRAGIRLV